MQVVQYPIRYSDLRLRDTLIAAALGPRSAAIPAPFMEEIREVIAAAPPHCAIEGGYVVRENLRLGSSRGILWVDDVPLATGSVICQHLQGSEKMAVFVCTAGPGIEEWSRQFMGNSQLAKGYIADIVGSCVVELAMDIIQGCLQTQMASKGLKITNRYSPGYCGWPVAEQSKLFSLLPEGFCGVRLNEACLMLPIKSVSGLIGIGAAVQPGPRTCSLCDRTNCAYRDVRELAQDARNPAPVTV